MDVNLVSTITAEHPAFEATKDNLEEFVVGLGKAVEGFVHNFRLARSLHELDDLIKEYHVSSAWYNGDRLSIEIDIAYKSLEKGSMYVKLRLGSEDTGAISKRGRFTMALIDYFKENGMIQKTWTYGEESWFNLTPGAPDMYGDPPIRPDEVTPT